MSGQVGRVSDYIILRIRDDDPFHRVYSAIHGTRRERVTLHLYDLADSADIDAESRARAEFDAHEWLRRHGWAPQIVDRLSAVPDTSGPRRLFFTVAEVSAPSVEARASDSGWSQPGRLRFLGALVDAISELRDKDAPGDDLAVSENLTAQTILVGAGNTPILSGLGIVRGADTGTVSPSPDQIAWELWDDHLCDKDSQGRPEIADKETLRSAITRARRTRPSGTDLLPPSRHWAAGQVVDVNGTDHKVVGSLGQGDDSGELKVVRLDRGEERHLRVGRVCFSEPLGEIVGKAHALAKRCLPAHPSLQTVEEVVAGWEDNRLTSVLSWVEGCAMDLLIGGDPSPTGGERRPHRERRVLKWLRHVCEGLRVMHDNGLVHGDVTPTSMIVNGDKAVLSGLDSVTTLDALAPQGDPVYSVASQARQRAKPAADVFSLATSLFHAVFGRVPIRQEGSSSPDPSLDWKGLDRDSHPRLAEFLDRATHPDSDQRFASATAVLEWLDSASPEERSRPRKKNKVEWLSKLLRSYPGGRYGNDEARGADSGFARNTRVPFGSEPELADAVKRRDVRLLVVSGNVGDGKTSMLQHIAEGLGVADWEMPSAHIREGTRPDGLRVRMNLDVSAAEGEDRLPDEILKEFLDPFENGDPTEDIACLLAINEDRLWGWIDKNEESPLVETLRELMGPGAAARGCVRLVMLNRRTLVGTGTGFLERLTDKLYGGDDAPGIWEPCQTCTAQGRCEVFRAAQLFGPANLPSTRGDDERARARARLFEAIQIAHLRGKCHVPIRDLRSALVYILFGLHTCRDYHRVADSLADDIFPYHDRAFSPHTPSRQGSLLALLLCLDPALDAHPRVDRHLHGGKAHDRASRASGRRRAYFEWSDGDVRRLTSDPNGLCLDNGQHMRVFMELPDKSEGETEAICYRLCQGMSRIEALPPAALGRENQRVLLPYPAWNPTETVFWVEKPLDRFSLRMEVDDRTEGPDRMHRAAILSYASPQGEISLRVDSGLFCRLMDLSEGYQLRDIAAAEAFANLAIFTQRLVEEGERSVFAWNPAKEETVYQVSVVSGREGDSAGPVVRIRRVTSGAGP